MQFLSHSLTDTYSFAATVAATLHGGEVILLQGQLGAGKTAFVKGLALALGIADTVTSPTFTLLNQYQGTQLKLYHFDLYRLGEGEAEDLGFDEFYFAPDAVCCIEWNRDPLQGGKVIRITADYVEGAPQCRMYRWEQE